MEKRTPSFVLNQGNDTKLLNATATIHSTPPPLDEQVSELISTPQRGGNFGKLAHLSVWRRLLITFSLLVGLLLSIMDTSIVSTSIYTISLEFNSLAKTIWVILAYSLADLGFAAIFARLSDFIGRRWAVIGAFVIFIAFSIGCGFARTIDQLIIFRAVQGIGGAGLYSLALTAIIETWPVEAMPIVSALIGATIAIAGVLGPLVGGLLTTYCSWRWIFWINGPCGGVALIIYKLASPSKTANVLVRRSFRDFDYVGSVLLLAAAILVVFGLQEGGTGASPWSSALTITTITVGGLSWFLLFGWQWYISHKHPKIAGIFPLHIWRDRALAAGILYTLFTGVIFLTIIFALPLRFQLLNGLNSSSSGIHLLPLLGSLAFGSFAGAAISTGKNRTFPVFCVATIFISIGTGLFTTLSAADVDKSVQTKVYGFQVILGLGIGMTFSNISLMTSLHCSVDDYAVTQGITATLRVLGGSIGVAASNALYNQQCRSELPAVGLSNEQIGQLQQSTSVLATFSEAQKRAVRVAYANAFRKTMWLCFGVSLVLVLLAAGTWMKVPPESVGRTIKKKKKDEDVEGEKQEAGSFGVVSIEKAV